MDGRDLVLVLRYRKAVTYGFHALLGALGQHETTTGYDVQFGESAEETAQHIREAGDTRVLVLWSFYSPDAAALAEELKQIRELADGPNVTHLAGGVHATAEPVQTLDAGWDMAAIGEGESTLLSLVDAKGDPAGITGLAYRDAAGNLIRTGKAKQRDLNDFPGFALKWDRFNALEITRGCIYACRFCQTPFMFSAKFRHRSVANVRWHVDQMRARGLRDVRFITPTALSYGSQTDEPNLAAVEELLASCREGIGPNGRVYFGSFPSEIRPEHVTRETLRLVKKYCDNNNIIVGAQSGSDRVLDAAKRGHGVEEVKRAARLGIEEGFRINVDMIFGMPGETPTTSVTHWHWPANWPTSERGSTRTRSCHCPAPRGGTRHRATSTRPRSARLTACPGAARSTGTGRSSATTPPAWPRPPRRTHAPAAAGPSSRRSRPPRKTRHLSRSGSVPGLMTMLSGIGRFRWFGCAGAMRYGDRRWPEPGLAGTA
jgi:B12-binding domain/radical SAM domain protein